MGGSKKSGGKPAQKPAAATASRGKADVKEKPRQTCLHSQLHKTKFCLYHLKGACQFGAACSFAHSCAELQATPDLRKTRLCINFFEGGGCNDATCTFAHSEEDLRSTDMFYKKTLCIWNEKGKCRNGDQCRFAHGVAELRLNQKATEKAPSVQDGDKEKEIDDKDNLNTGEDLGRQVSDMSQVTTASGASGASDATAATSITSITSASQMTADRPAKVHTTAGGLTAASLSQLNQSMYDPMLEAELRYLRASVNALAMQCSQINDQINAEKALVGRAALHQQLLQLAQARQQESAAAQALPLLFASRLGMFGPLM
mmetsp:Transcript_8100/g.14139  ORF Transcript_8100/g.14139 Transcript_8100/m.14139 type:complete len:316 (-) Transcript_8100:304-1251(-)